ncbi:serine/threonine protein phosphatase [Bacillus sp. M6-12]|uniref:serine/threonine protein phosphatase n=1 Tax=Bacillus sp. M6-12 TaxID=2054166 RepID=UPI000C76D5BA|nr:serine/threonine protein phosphatase [Bacillus sp. M6-12]PLS15048.1 serine/threonine protein phosphatase [Bacillus sp. M6-12]
MRKLFLLRGAPGVGKSTLLKELKVDEYALNSDMYRMALQSPLLTESGEFKINQMYGRREAWHMLYETLDKRMYNGDFVIIDATHSKPSDMMAYRALADKYRYEIIVVDFSSIPMEVAKERNLMRDEHKQVPEATIEKHYLRFHTSRVPDGMKIVHYQDAKEAFYLSPVDYSHYKAIHHIGDIHGCYTALMSYLKEGIKEDELYIFTGDFIDRGIENGEVLEFLFSIMELPNVIFLEGNHERHLWKWANGEKAYSLVFEQDTKPELEEYGINKKEAKRFCRKLKELVYYTYKDKEVLVTHGGLPVIPKNLHFVSAEQIIRGVGDYKTPIDEIFNTNEKGTNRYQIHGHRNHGLLPYTPDTQSFNLEGGVDSGGYLRTITLNNEGFSSLQVKNNVFKQKQEAG